VRTRIKICGLTREEDVESVLDMGVDALGFVFYNSSPRYVSPVRARDLISLCPAWVCTVGLFVNSSREEILRISDISGINQIQLHGDELIDDCKSLYRPVVKAIRIPVKKNPNKRDYDKLFHQLIESKRYLDFCSAVLLDADSSGFGGSGKSFDWNVLNEVGSLFGNRWVLSGGLNIKNISSAIDLYKPPSIDVSSGVETSQNGLIIKGVKDREKIKVFVDTVAKKNSEI
jgi:phosphoribosylanthranilate isomerase